MGRNSSGVRMECSLFLVKLYFERELVMTIKLDPISLLECHQISIYNDVCSNTASV